MSEQRRKPVITPADAEARRLRASAALRSRALGFLLIGRDVIAGAQELLPAPGDKKLKRALDLVQRAIETLCTAPKRTKGTT